MQDWVREGAGPKVHEDAGLKVHEGAGLKVFLMVEYSKVTCIVSWNCPSYHRSTSCCCLVQLCRMTCLGEDAAPFKLPARTQVVGGSDFEIIGVINIDLRTYLHTYLPVKQCTSIKGSVHYVALWEALDQFLMPSFASLVAFSAIVTCLHSDLE